MAPFWKRDLDLYVEYPSQNHIDAIINKGKANAWCFTGFYGASETHLRFDSWNLLKDLFALLWLCVRDVNELLKSHEESGGRLRPYGHFLWNSTRLSQTQVLKKMVNC